MDKMENLKFECCFCAKEIEKKIDLLILISDYNKPKKEQISQQFFSHIRCLVKRMDTTIRNATKDFGIESCEYVCCFCASDINEELAALIMISNFEQPKTQQSLQQFYCHTPCFTTQLSYAAKPHHAIDLEEAKDILPNTIKKSDDKKHTQGNTMENTKYECSFCTKDIKGPVATLAAISHWEKPKAEQYAQQFFFHMSCFRNSLSPIAKSESTLLEPESE